MTEETKIDGRSREARQARTTETLADIPLPDAVSGEEEGKVTRSTRKPFGSQTQKLAFPQREGFHRHWFNDTPGRIDSAKEAGYVHVKDPVTGQNVQRVVGTTAQGTALMAFIMEIPKEWWDEDMAVYAKAADEKEESIRRGQVDKKSAQDRDDHFRNVAQGRKIDIRNTAQRR